MATTILQCEILRKTLKKHYRNVKFVEKGVYTNMYIFLHTGVFDEFNKFKEKSEMKLLKKYLSIQAITELNNIDKETV